MLPTVPATTRHKLNCELAYMRGWDVAMKLLRVCRWLFTSCDD